MQLSLFNGWTDESPMPIELDALVEMMRTDASLRDLTDKHRYYRSIGDKAGAQHYKRRMPCFSVAVRFEGGKRKEHIAAFTRLTLVDIDHVSPDDMPRVLTLVGHDPHTLLAYTTISGQGVRVVVRYTLPAHPSSAHPSSAHPLTAHPSSAHPSPFPVPRSSFPEYKSAFLQVNAYYETLTGLATDPLCKNATRLSGAAYNPTLHYNPAAVPFEVQLEAKRPSGRPRQVRTAEAAEPHVCEQLERRGVCYIPGEHNRYISQACYLMNRYGVSEPDCTAWALARFADYAAAGNDVASIVRSCYQQTTEHATRQLPREKKDSCATVAEIQDYLTQKEVRIRHNVISRKWEIGTHCPPSAANAQEPSLLWTELTDRHVHSLYRAFSLDTGRRLRLSDLFIIIESDFYPEYHPMREYMTSLSPWDGHDYIEELASRVHVAGCTQEMHNRYFRKWFVGMVAAWFDPDKTNHEILTYIGSQGIFKSTFMRHLLPPVLRDYFSARNFAHRMDRDDRLELTEMALIALEELDNLKPRALNQLKALTTDPSVNERAAYARYRERREHIASFCATGNNPRFLTDLTGNRRWLPFMVDSIDSPYDHPIPYEGLYAQAYALWREGFPYWFTAEENAELECHNHHFEEPNMECELIQTYFRRPESHEVGEFYTATRIIETINIGVKTPLQPRTIAIWMNRLGYQPRRHDNIRGWNVILLTHTDIKLRQQETARLSALE